MRIRPGHYDPRDPNANPLNKIVFINERSMVGVLLKQKFPDTTHMRRLNWDLKKVDLDDGAELAITRAQWEALKGVPGMRAFDVLGDVTIESQTEREIGDGQVDIQSWLTVVPTPKGSWGDRNAMVPDEY